MQSLNPSLAFPRGFEADIKDEEELELLQLPPLIPDETLFFEDLAGRPGSTLSEHSFRGTPDPKISGIAEAIVASHQEMLLTTTKLSIPKEPAALPEMMDANLLNSIPLLEASHFKELPSEPKKSEKGKKRTLVLPPDFDKLPAKAKIEAVVKAKLEQESVEEQATESKAVKSRRHTDPKPAKPIVAKRRASEPHTKIPANLKNSCFEGRLKNNSLELYNSAEIETVLKDLREARETQLRQVSEEVRKTKFAIHGKILKKSSEENKTKEQTHQEPLDQFNFLFANFSCSNAIERFFSDPRNPQIFHPENVYQYVQALQGTEFSPVYLTDIPLMRFSDIHSLPNGESIDCRHLLFNQTLALEIEKGLLPATDLKRVLSENLNHLPFIDVEVHWRLRTVIERFDGNDFTLELFSFLENLTKHQYLNQSLYLISFLCYFFPHSSFLAIVQSDYMMRKGFYEQSAESLKKVLAYFPNATYAKIILAECFFFLGDVQAALVQVSAVRSHYPRCLHTTSLMSAILSDLQKGIDPGLSAIIEQSPSYSYPLALRAEFYFQNKHYQEASIDYKRLLEINPKFVYAYHRYHLTLGILNANNGRV